MILLALNGWRSDAKHPIMHWKVILLQQRYILSTTSIPFPITEIAWCKRKRIMKQYTQAFLGTFTYFYAFISFTSKHYCAFNLEIALNTQLFMQTPSTHLLLPLLPFTLDKASLASFPPFFIWTPENILYYGMK